MKSEPMDAHQAQTTRSHKAMAGYQTLNDANSDDVGDETYVETDQARASAHIDETGGVAMPFRLATIRVIIRDTEANQQNFQLKSTTQLGKAMRHFAARKEMRVEDLRFLLDGQRVNVKDTPDSLEMEDGDVIDVHFFQIGGGGDIQ